MWCIQYWLLEELCSVYSIDCSQNYVVYTVLTVRRTMWCIQYWLFAKLCSEAGLLLLYLCCLWRQILPCHAWFLLAQIAEGSCYEYSVDKLARISAAFWVYKWSLHSCNSCTADAHTSIATAFQASYNCLHSTWNSWVSLVLAASHYTGQM